VLKALKSPGRRVGAGRPFSIIWISVETTQQMNGPLGEPEPEKCRDCVRYYVIIVGNGQILTIWTLGADK
jgi:hypothetical protein